MTAAWAATLCDSDKLVLLALADWADDDGLCWPSIKKLAVKCSKSERTVQRAISALAEGGHLTRQEVVGKGCKYNLHPRHGDTPVKLAPVTRCHQTPVTVTPNTSRHTITSEAKASSLPRARPSKRCPVDWRPDDGVLEVGRKSGLSPGEIDRELETLRDYEFRSAKTDWNATARNWLRTAGTRNAKPSRPERITSIAGLNERDRRAGGIVGLLD